MVNMKPWNWVSLRNALLISVLPLVVGVSCTSDKPKQETAQPSSQDNEPTLKKALSETDLHSSPGLVVIHCRKLSRVLAGQPFPGDGLRSKCVEAMLIMAEQATLGQSPEMMRKSPEEWMNEARSFGASKESISRAKKRIAADKKKADAEEKRQESAFLRVRGQGMMDFVVIGENLSRDQVALERRVRNFCDLQRGPSSFCWVLMWLKPSMVPREIPMSDKQQRAQFAVYTRNPTSGYDCLQLLRNGDEYGHSGKCDS